MQYTFSEIKEQMCRRISHHLFVQTDIAVATKALTVAPPLFDNEETIETGLLFTYPSILFLTLSGTALCLKVEVLNKFGLSEFIKNSVDISNKGNSTFIKVDDTQAFYDKFYSIATELFLFYLNQKELSHFGCCSQNVECSAIGHCVNKNKELFCGCDYRRNLENGKNFYRSAKL